MSRAAQDPPTYPPNHLAGEKSPYLLQHLHNPVDWHPWGEAAFARARAENKPVFLSIGYSTCHWCHVMAHDSFEDDEVAALLNQDYIAIKVDREERPDIDQVYMEVCQRMTGGGGWPLTIIMTPTAQPFYAATFIPKHGGQGRPGMVDLLPFVADKWRREPDELNHAAQQVIAAVQGAVRHGSGPVIDRATLTKAVAQLRQRFDPRHGGFGPAPKFPTPHNLTFLLQRYHQSGDAELLEMVEATLGAMRRGGIYDQLGGGFHRYATDANWLVPHFEKMLYDQAGLMEAYTEAFRATGKPLYAETVREIFAYLQRDLTDPEGGFYSAEDADSEGEEGKFYVWEQAEIADALGAQAAGLFCRAYGVTAAGNYHDEASGAATGTSILHRPAPLEQLAADAGLSLAELEAGLAENGRALMRVRERRVRPHRDDKVLTAWNGLMISSLARAAVTLGEPQLLAAAERAADFILARLRRSDGRLLRRYREGEAAIPAFAEDYAFLSRGLLDLYAAGFAVPRLAQALELAGELHRQFHDTASGGLFDTAADSEPLVLRPRSAYDGALPAASSAALEVYARLSLLTSEPCWRERGERLLAAVSAEVSRYPSAYTQLLQGAAWLLEPTREIVISGMPGASDTEALLAVARRAGPGSTTILLRPADRPEALTRLAPFVAGLLPIGQLATAYCCQDFTCHKPVTQPVELADLLK